MRVRSLQQKLFFRVFALIVVSISIIGLGSYRIARNNVTELTYVTCEQVIQKTSSEINEIFIDMTNLPKVIGRDSKIQSAMRTSYENDMSGQFSKEFEIDAFLSDMNKYNTDMFCIYFLGENGIIGHSQYYTIAIENLNENQLYKEACAKKQTLWLKPNSGSFFSITTGEPLITTITPIEELGTGTYLGIVVVEIKEKIIKKFMETKVGNSGFLYIENENGEPIVWPESMTMEEVKIAIKKESVIFFKKMNPIFLKQKLDYSGWTLVGLIPIGDLVKSSEEIMWIITITCIAVAFASFFVSYRLAVKTIDPINRLNMKMKNVEKGDFSVRIDVKQNDEIGDLMLRFNDMVQKIDDLIKREAENQKLLRMTELKALQEQIKPHFLYNTLDSIVWLARANEQDNVVKMVLSLTNFLKIGLNQGDEIISIKDEISHVNHYLSIQSFRYRDKFDYEIEMDETIANYQIPKLLLQPLAENAIYHGIKLKNTSGKLIVKAKDFGDKIIISVEDDGVGMDEIEAKTLRGVLEQKEKNHSNSYGVANIDERIKLIFGEHYGVTFKTQKGLGSTFYITISKIFLGESDD